MTSTLTRNYNAAVLVRLIDAFRAANRPERNLQWRDFKLGPLTVQEWGERLRAGEVEGWEHYVSEQDRDDPPYYLCSFINAKDTLDFENGIIDSVNRHRETIRTGALPSIRSGPIRHVPFADKKGRFWQEYRDMIEGKTWEEFSEMVRKQEGPFRDIFFGDEHGDFHSLHDFLVRKNIKEGKPDLTDDLIKEAIELHKKETGHYPDKKSGPVLYGRLAQYGETWMAIDAAFQVKMRGLEDSPHDTLRDFMMAEGYLKIKLEDIRASVRETLAHDEPLPDSRSGVIKYGPLADGERTWGSVDKIFKKSRHFLAEPDCEYTTLHEFLVGEGFIKEITKELIPQIAQSARLQIADNSRVPRAKDGMIKHGELADQWKWSQIEEAATSGKLPPYTSLHRLLVGEKVVTAHFKDPAHYPKPSGGDAAPAPGP